MVENNCLTDNIRGWITKGHGGKRNPTKLKTTERRKSCQKQRCKTDTAQKSHHTNLAWKRASHLQSPLWYHSLQRLVIQCLHFHFSHTILLKSFSSQREKFPNFSTSSRASCQCCDNREPQTHRHVESLQRFLWAIVDNSSAFQLRNKCGSPLNFMKAHKTQEICKKNERLRCERGGRNLREGHNS